MKYIISTLWVLLTTAGLLGDGVAFNLALTSTLTITAMFLIGIPLTMCAIAMDRYDLADSLPNRGPVLRTIELIVDMSLPVAIASIGHPIMAAVYVCIYGTQRALIGTLKAEAKKHAQA